jgi:acyl-CoA thioester hydrolase
MQLLHESEVGSDEIDHLGHLNVRFYMERAQAGNAALLAACGLAPEALGGARAVQDDTYTRYQREQFQGSVLQVKGGVLAAAPTGVAMYLEVANDARREVAATFIFNTVLVDPATRAPRPIPDAAVAAASAARIELPEHGRPRTIDPARRPRLDIAYADLAARLDDDASDPMSRRMERVIKPDECDEHGFQLDTQDAMFGGLRAPPRGREAMLAAMREGQWGPMTYTSQDGRRFGWATMEMRVVRVRQPRAGDRLVSIGAEIGLAAKTRHSRRWVFDAQSGALMMMNDNVNIALDLDARRSIEIPPEHRIGLERRHAPEFA